MANFTKNNLVKMSPYDVKTGTLAMKVGDVVLTAGEVTILNAIEGTDVSDTTATAEDVLQGKRFYNAEGNLTQGTYVPAPVGGSAEYFKCVAVGEKAEEGGSGDSSAGNSTDINIRIEGYAGNYGEFEGRWILKDPTATGANRVWVQENNDAEYKYNFTMGRWVLWTSDGLIGPSILDDTGEGEPIGKLDTSGSVDEIDGDCDIYAEWASSGSSGDSPSSELPEPVFYAPLTEQKTTAETGQALTYNGNVQFTEIDGRKCAYFDGNHSYISTSDVEGINYGMNPRTVAFCVKGTENGGYAVSYGSSSFGYGDWHGIKCSQNFYGLGGYGGGNDFWFDFETPQTGWYYFAITSEGDKHHKIYINSKLVQEFTTQHSVPLFLDVINIGMNSYLGNIDSDSYKGYIADVRIYNVALSAKQIAELQPYVPEIAPNTWNGQRALLLTDAETGKPYYDFEETVTEGLTFGNGFTPVKDGVYDREAMVKVNLFEKVTIPQEGLVLKADLTSGLDSNIALSGLPEFKEINGRQCAYMNGTTCVHNDSFNAGNQFTVAFAVCGNPFKQGDPLLGIGVCKNYSCIEVLMNYNTQYPAIYLKSGYADDAEECSTNIETGWHHLILTWDGELAKLYVDNALSGTHSWSGFNIANGIALGANYNDSGQVSRHSYTTAGYQLWRVYNRLLTDDERTLLYQEFSK